MENKLKKQREPRSPMQEGNVALRGCLWGVFGMLLAGGLFALLFFVGGTVGKAILAALGFGTAGLFLPWFSGSEPHSHNQERFMLYMSLVFAVGGLGVGVYLVISGAEPPWWVFALAGLCLVVLGLWAGWRWHERRHDV